MAARSESFFRVLGQGLFCGKPVFCPTFDKNAFSQSKQVSRRLGKVSFSKQTLQKPIRSLTINQSINPSIHPSIHQSINLLCTKYIRCCVT